METLNEATGATTNLEKTTILLINKNDKKSKKNTPDITIKEQHEKNKVLGIM